MPIICPTILAADEDKYRQQIERVAGFAHRIQIDLTDGDFAPVPTIVPQLVWWPVGMQADLHLMYKNPQSAVEKLLEHGPHMIIIHAEASGRFDPIVHLCRKHKVKIGIAMLPSSHPASIVPALEYIDHVLLFSGDLGRFGGHANLDLLRKVDFLKNHKRDLEIGWDGGVNSQNISQLVSGGVDVLNVGGFIQNADDPERAFHTLQRIADETGTT